MMTINLDLAADIINVRDIIARVEELENESVAYSDESDDDARTAAWAAANPGDAAELAALRAILDNLKGYGGDEKWRGDWYPVTLVRDSHFRDYAEQLAEKCGYTDEAARDSEKNPLLAYIDWKAWARDVRMDYTPVDIDGCTYWYR